jgi:predicted RNA-binding Zn ribbon-like protein
VLSVIPAPVSERPAAQAKQVAGRLCLDFANLAGGWEGVSVPCEDRLTDYPDLLAWSWRAGLLDDSAVSRLWRAAGARPRAAVAVLARARGLRDALHAIAWTLERNRPQRSADLATLSAAVREARERQRLEAQGGRLVWCTVAEPQDLDAPLWPVALSAESYFTGADLSRLRSCPGDHCGWHFDDSTRNRSRRWCDMGDCGNVAKVRRFRSRQRDGRGR